MERVGSLLSSHPPPRTVKEAEFQVTAFPSYGHTHPVIDCVLWSLTGVLQCML
jgi:hypothetical protein